MLDRTSTCRLPAQCRVCNGAARGSLCEACRHRFSTVAPRCRGCGLALPPRSDRAPACITCLTQPADWRLAVCAEDYAFPWNELVAEFKFRGDAALAGLLADRLSVALQNMPHGLEVDLVLPVPLSPQRLQERGFNQAWELCRRLARRLKLPARADLLQRPVHSLTHQAELGLQERSQHLRGTFMVAPRLQHEIRGQRVALVDDVMTTGATFREATRVLLATGAVSVDVWAVARTP